MINLDSITNENNKEHNKKWLDHLYIPGRLYRILIIGGSRSGKRKELLNLIKVQDDIDQIYLHAKDLSEPKFEFLIKKGEDAETKHFSDPNAFIDCSNIVDDVYENIDDCNPNRQRKVLIVFDNMTANIMSNKKTSRYNQRIIY